MSTLTRPGVVEALTPGVVEEEGVTALVAGDAPAGMARVANPTNKPNSIKVTPVTWRGWRPTTRSVVGRFYRQA